MRCIGVCLDFLPVVCQSHLQASESLLAEGFEFRCIQALVIASVTVTMSQYNDTRVFKAPALLCNLSYTPVVDAHDILHGFVNFEPCRRTLASFLLFVVYIGSAISVRPSN